MKKILSVMLAIMMLFGALSVSASAAVTNDEIIREWHNSSSVITIGNTTYAKQDYVIIQLNFNGGTSFVSLPVYDTTEGGFVHEKVSGTYLMLPGSSNEYSLQPNTLVTLPRVTPPEGKQFTGWYCENTGEYVVGGKTWAIPANSGSSLYTFTAELLPAEGQEDTMQMVLGILMKIFGTIIGILFLDGSSAAGVELMEKMLGGLLG